MFEAKIALFFSINIQFFVVKLNHKSSRRLKRLRNQKFINFYYNFIIVLKLKFQHQAFKVHPYHGKLLSGFR